jgi:hypothetical protein
MYRMHMKHLSALLVISAMFVAPAAQASDPLIEGAKLCTKQLPRYEREYGIPTHLLSAIATTESGRYHSGLKINVPWPWTINANGKGYYFDSKAEAIAAARSLKARGIQSMDVGCMQVNIMHHPNAFRSLDEAFEPQNNVAYAASFLRNLYESDRSWKEAAADYHSKTPARGREYVDLVYTSWYNIIDKLRMAKLQVPNSSVVAMNNMKTDTSETRTEQAKTIKLASAQPTPLPEQKGKKVATYKSPRMNSIKVSGQRERGIVVVRPAIKVVDAPAPTVVTYTQPASLTLTGAKPLADASSAKVVHVNDLSPSAGKKGPTFIFND